MADDQTQVSGVDSEEENADWNRTVTDDEAQDTALHADPDDLGSSSSTDTSIAAGGDATDLGSGDDGSGGTPYTSGYVTGGAHHPTIDDLPSGSQ